MDRLISIPIVIQRALFGKLIDARSKVNQAAKRSS